MIERLTTIKMNQIFNDELKDKILGICTTGRDDKNADDSHSPYEPTAYAVLDRIINEEYFTASNVIVDFGCGKGRVPIYISHKCGCKSVGIEMENHLYAIAENNLSRSKLEEQVTFIMGMAENMIISSDMDRFFFFNPFSYDICKSVLNKIINSVYETPREAYLFFYYPSDEYMGRLMTERNLMFVDEICCKDLFGKKDEREKVVIFEVI